MASLSMKETTPAKIDSIEFKAGQYIQCVNNIDDTFSIYYDSIIKNSRVMIKSGDLSEMTEEEVNNFNQELWEK